MSAETVMEIDPFAERIEQRQHLRLTNSYRPAPIPTIPSWAAAILVETRARAKKRETKFTLDAWDLAHMLDRAAGHCEVSGVPFDFTKGAGFRRPFRPSIDRIDCARGYTSGNCRLVVYAANAAMNEWGLAVLLAVARGVVKKHGGEE